MPSAVLYARYSSDLQREASIADQLRLLRERAAKDGLDVVATFTDAAISGASTINRPGLQQLLAGARDGAGPGQVRFEIVLAEALDRLSRDQEDVAGIWKRLRHAGVRLITLAEGEVDELHIGLKGTMNALFLRDLAAKVRRGQRGRVEAGRIPGGLTYGYRRLREVDAAGEIEGGRRAIDEAQAAIVRRIFADFAAGLSPRAIAAALNREGVAAPRGGAWNASTINGHRARRNGILNNELYAGRIVYNRQSFAKDPDSGKRQARPNPKAAWIVREVPALRLVPEDLWRAAEALKARHAAYPAHALRRPKRLLSGLLECGRCGAPYTMRDAVRLGCSAHRERGTCDNAATLRAEALERRILGGLKERLLAPDLVAEAVRAIEAERARLRRRHAGDAATAERRAGELDRAIARLVAAIAEGTDTPGMRRALVAAEAERGALERRRAGRAAAPIVLHPNLAELYRRRVADLETALAASPHDRAAAFAALRGMIERVIVHAWPGEDAAGLPRTELRLELHGSLAGILAALETEKGAPVSRGALPERAVSMMVAGGGSVRFPHAPPLVIWL